MWESLCCKNFRKVSNIECTIVTWLRRPALIHGDIVCCRHSYDPRLLMKHLLLLLLLTHEESNIALQPLLLLLHYNIDVGSRLQTCWYVASRSCCWCCLLHNWCRVIRCGLCPQFTLHNTWNTVSFLRIASFWTPSISAATIHDTNLDVYPIWCIHTAKKVGYLGCFLLLKEFWWPRLVIHLLIAAAAALTGPENILVTR